MLRNRLIYLAALLGGVVFYGFFYVWFSWYLLVLLLCLPWFSLLLSLPAMVTMKLQMSPPGKVHRNEQAELRLQTVCRLPQPMCRFTLRIHESAAGRQTACKARPRALQMTMQLPTGHCGMITCTVARARVFDYLGLFSLPRRWRCLAEVPVLPLPQPPEKLPSLAQLQALSYQPKPGGGFSEVHELRDYRPGDSLREVHWKLTAKVDRPIIREPQQPQQGPVVLTLDLAGTPKELDSCLDQTCWLSHWLLELGVSHAVRWLSAAGPQSYPLSCREDLDGLAEQLCRSELTPAGSTSRGWATDACWHYHVLPREETAP